MCQVHRQRRARPSNRTAAGGGRRPLPAPVKQHEQQPILFVDIKLLLLVGIYSPLFCLLFTYLWKILALDRYLPNHLLISSHDPTGQ